MRSRRNALGFAHVQLNSPASRGFITLDVDEATAALDAIDRDNLPSIIVGNPVNGHAHTIYMLSRPVTGEACNGRASPLRMLAAVERGLTRKYRGDQGYSGLIAKNPLNSRWRTTWTGAAYDLTRLRSELTDEHVRPHRHIEREIGAGRNVACFEMLRAWAVRNVRAERRNGIGFDGWHEMVLNTASGINLSFDDRMTFGEVRSIAKSVSKWTWRKATDEAFSASQRARRQKRTELQRASAINAERDKPWVKLGISRRTYYRRKSGLIVAF